MFQNAFAFVVKFRHRVEIPTMKKENAYITTILRKKLRTYDVWMKCKNKCRIELLVLFYWGSQRIVCLSINYYKRKSEFIFGENMNVVWQSWRKSANGSGLAACFIVSFRAIKANPILISFILLKELTFTFITFTQQNNVWWLMLPMAILICSQSLLNNLLWWRKALFAAPKW